MAKKTMVFIFVSCLTLGSLASKWPFGFQAYAAFDCLTLTITSSQTDKDYCRQELVQIEAELTDLLNKQKEQQKQTGTLKGDINYLTGQINALKTKIQARLLVIAQLKVSITEKVSKIESLSEKIAREHESLAQLLRNTNEFDNENIIHLILSDKSISNFYSDLESYTSIKKAVKASVDQINGIKNETEIQKKDLEIKQNAEIDAKVELENARKKTAQSEAEKKVLLSLSQQKEFEYQKLAVEKKAQADKIRAALFPLRDSEAIPFGVALQYAEQASLKTGVRSAFILAILKQESNMGANVGSCVITNLSTGQTKSINAGTIFNNGIHPTRDLPILRSIVQSLDRNPLTTRVSCPYMGGYGGAMGPAQFIPSTWDLIKSQISSAVDKAIPDPWHPLDAITASSILLRDNGAAARTFTAEREAACRYYSGKKCSDPTVKNIFYGNAVMEYTQKIQTDIDLLYNQ